MMVNQTSHVAARPRLTPHVGRICALLFVALALALALGSALGAPTAFADDAPDPFAQGAETDLAAGDYSAEVALIGGSGRATIASPALVTVKDGHAALTLVWSSSNYDYMKVGDGKYIPTTLEPGSTFQIPILAFDEPFTVVGDTTAMSQPHEIEYQIEVKKDSIAPGAPAPASQDASSASSASASASAASASASAASASSSAASSSTSGSSSASSGTAPASGNDLPIVPIVVIAIIVVALIVGVIVKRKGGNE